MAFAGFWTAMILLHGHFFLVKTPHSFPIFETIGHGSTSAISTTKIKVDTAQDDDDYWPLPSLLWRSILWSSWIKSALKLFFLHYISAVLGSCFKAFRNGDKIEIAKHVQEGWRVPLRALAAAYVLEYLVRETLLLAMAANMDAVLNLDSREDLRGVVKAFVKL